MLLARQRRWAEAEPLLVENVPRLPRHEARSKRAVRFVTSFYAEWTSAAKDPSVARRAAEWPERLAPKAGS